MISLTLHPALRKLIRAQRLARWKQVFRRLRSPRRLALSVVAVFLAIIWLGQAVAALLLRQAASPDKLAVWIPLSLAGYAIWNVLKISCRTPVEPFEWTESEREWLIGAPIERRELIKYRLSSISMAAALKSAIFTLMMSPDLKVLVLGFVGMFCGLMLIDLVRLGLEVGVYGLKRRERVAVRVGVLSLAVTSASFAFFGVMGGPSLASDLASAASIGFLLSLLSQFVAQAEMWHGLIVTAPFRLLTSVMLAESVTWEVTAILLGYASGLIVALIGLAQLDRLVILRRHQFETDRFEMANTKTKRSPNDCELVGRAWTPIRLGGVGPLLWRQWIGARKYRISLLVATVVPFVLSCLPAFSDATSFQIFLNVVGGLAIYSFLLLPSAFKFDFRRDVSRLTVLKSMPMPPLSIVLGQLALPVAMTTVFQFAVLSAVMLLHPYNPILIPIALSILIPFNSLIFAYENLVFLWYPHRMNQEGMNVLIRSLLSFTAKGFLIGIVFIGAVTWVFVSKSFASQFYPESVIPATQVTFIAGITIAMSLLALTVVRMTVSAFDRFDPSSDLEGLD